MKTVPQGHCAQSRVGSVASTAVAIALAIFGASFFTYANIIWHPGYYGEYGLSVYGQSVDLMYSVEDVVPGSPADKAGVKVGDRVGRPQTLHDRLVVWRIAPHPGERITLSILRGSQRRTVTLQARPLPPLPLINKVILGLKFIWLLVFVAVGFVLVLLRPSKMTWGFYLFALNLTILFWPSDLYFSYIPPGWFVALAVAEDIVAPAGVAGFLVFAVRFPANALTGWRRLVESLAPYLFIALATYIIYVDLGGILFTPRAAVVFAVHASLLAIFMAGTIALLFTYSRMRGPERRRIIWVIFGLLGGVAAAAIALRLEMLGGRADVAGTAVATLLLGTIVLLITYLDASGLERQRIKWVVLGLICALVAHALDLFTSINPPWFELLNAALPLSVAYAVLRHRVIDVRFAASRALAVGVIASIVALIVIGIDWLFSTKLPASRLQAAVYVGLALLVGFSLNATWRSIGRTIDFLFFRQWHRTQEQAGALADAMRRAASRTDLYEPLTAGVAGTFSLASVALFERVEGAGFVRVAARGWSPGTIWHILADDPPVVRAGDSPRVVDIDALQWHERDLPAGVARPTIMLPIAAGRRVPAMLLCGAHENGTGLDPDEIRAIRRLCADAGLTYGRAPGLESGRTGLLTEPLRV